MAHLDHQSKEFAEKIIALTNHPGSGVGDEQAIRDAFFDCYSKAYSRGYVTGINQAPHREDMGR